MAGRLRRPREPYPFGTSARTGLRPLDGSEQSTMRGGRLGACASPPALFAPQVVDVIHRSAVVRVDPQCGLEIRHRVVVLVHQIIGAPPHTPAIDNLWVKG